MHTVRMPRPGQMTEECVLVAWRKEEGERVVRGDVLFEIETDKATMEVEAFEEGVLLRRTVAEGQSVPVNEVCAYIGEPGEPFPEDDPTPVDAASAAELETLNAGLAAGTLPGAGASAPPSARTRRPTAPAMGSDGSPRNRRVRMSPRARRRAAELGVDPATVVGSGPDGRIVERDVLAASTGVSGPASAAPAEAHGEGRRPLSRMRQVIASRLTESAAVPQFTVTVAVDVTRLMELRGALAVGGRALAVTDYLLIAVARALFAMPIVNSRTDGVSVWIRRRVHLGLPVALDGGLVVPVIRDAHQLTIWEIHDRAAELVAAARAGKLPPDDMSGSTFSVSNLGMYGVQEFAAIVNPGESAILAVGEAAPTPVVLSDGGVGVRTLMRTTLTADHRLIDGAVAARFLADVRRRLEAPDGL